MGNRTALLISCSVEDAQKIRHEAQIERRTVAAYVLNILSRALAIEEKLANQLTRFQQLNRILARTPVRGAGKRTAILIRCTVEESNRIRMAAKRRDTTISGFVLHCLNRNWEIARGVFYPRSEPQ